MIRFLHPEAFLLAALVVLVLRRRFVSTGPATALRVLVVLLLAAILAEPYAATSDRGRDLVVVVDRSRSVPEASAPALSEAIDRAAKEARAAGQGDRVGVVAFGRDAALESVPRERFQRTPLTKAVDRDATDVAAAVDAALAAIPPGRPGSILLVTDGETTGEDPDGAARRASRRGVRIDAIPLRRAGAFDVAVEEVTLPPDVAAGEPFEIAAWIRSEQSVEATVRLLRDGQPVAEGRRTLRAGAERVLFRDAVGEPGVHEFAVEVSGVRDRVPENDRARSVLRVEGRFRVLVVTPSGRADRLSGSLKAAGIDVVVSDGPTAPLTLDALDGFRAVVLEDVPAADLPPGALGTLREWVTDHAGGLLMTGGRASFGPGGYHQSPVAEVLPVSLEMRKEQRKFAISMAIVLDRSGSMMAAAEGGPTKMDLANRGAVAAVDLLTSIDAVSVIAVDSIPHVVVPLEPVVDRASIAKRALAIESGGGGIFVSTGLHAAAEVLTHEKEDSGRTRHIVLFADADDAEEPGDYETFVPALRKAGVTVSVIGMGQDTDSGAEFLKDVAKRGGGRCFFAAEAEDLPRVFAQETIEVARSAMVEEACEVATLPDLVAVGALGRLAFPSVGGYTIAYLKAGAQAGLRTKDEIGAPLLSFHQHGLGRAAAYLGVADGSLSGGLATWDGYAEFFATLVRWVAGTEATEAVHATAVRRGHEGLLSVEVERGREDVLARIEARVSGGADGVATARPVDLSRTGATRLEGRFPIATTGVVRPTIGLGDGRFLRVSPLVLPYSPEFAPRADPADGEALLRRLCARTGGRVDPPSGTLFDGPRESRVTKSLVPLLALLAVVAFVLEILVRRTSWRPSFGKTRNVVLWIGARVRRVLTRRGATPAPASGVASDATSIAAAAAATSERGRAVRRDAGARLDAPPVPPAPPDSPTKSASATESGGIASVMDRLKKRGP